MTNPWGDVDLFSISLGLIIVVVGLARKAGRTSVAELTGLLASGIALGPLLMIVADPVLQILARKMGLEDYRLLDAVLREGRATLWWAAAVASLYLVRDVFR